MRTKLIYRLLLLSGLGLAWSQGRCCMPHSASSRAPVVQPGAPARRSSPSSGERRATRARRRSPRASCTHCSTRRVPFGAGLQRDRLPPRGVEIAGTEGCRNEFIGGGQTNSRVTQDCSLRAQAGENIAVNPLDPSNILVGQNDSRIGFNHCGYAWTLDGGSHWGDQTPPFFQVPLLNQKPAEACANPTVAWDSEGNAYIAGTIFDIAAPENAVVVAKSNAKIHGAFFHSPDVGERVPGVQRTAPRRGHERRRGLRRQAVHRGGRARRRARSTTGST